ncbi:ArsR family transcriptional regulator [Sphingobacteriales bacterium UPWRP_1]|nr:transcriptional regulator [Sphingobacteriales bacterium TSM_CSS]PSJ77395.1 ArsR family transcriptional regulator [Sphingobacteriales bacterium UPWRP_1]
MAVNKKNEFPDAEAEAAGFAKLLSHPARIAILQALAARQTCICGELVEVLPLSQSTVSQHLKELREGGLISGQTEGVKSCYCIN